MFIGCLIVLLISYFVSCAADNSSLPLLLTIGLVILHYLEDILRELKKK